MYVTLAVVRMSTAFLELICTSRILNVSTKNDVMTGNFNCPDIDGKSMTGDQDNTKFIFCQVVHQVTRESYILELVIVNDLGLINDRDGRKSK